MAKKATTPNSGDKGLYRGIVRQLPFPLAIVNNQGKILSCNPAFDRFFGESIIHTGRNLGEYLSRDSLQVFLEGMASLIKNETQEFSLDITALNAENLLQYLTLQGSILPLDGGRFQFLCIFQNVSDFMDENQRLRREKDLAEQATRSKSTFLANMSHEIRTPIHTVTGMTELILDTSLDDEQKEYVQQIRFAAEALLGLINDILDFSKIEAGKLHIENIDFDLESTLENALDMQSLEAFRRGLEVVLLVESRLPSRLKGDPIRLRQIITNLLSNAIKFTRQGHVLARISIQEENDQEVLVRFAVEDTGIGIPEEKKVLLFQAFSQVDASMTRKFGGTGLGLSICRSLVHLMGGEIGVESEGGKGATFWFALPFLRSPEHGAEQDFRITDPLRILVVDDSLACRTSVRLILESAGCRVAEARDASEALEALRQALADKDPFQTALVDLEMPGMDGWQMASQVNADRELNSTRLILMNPPGKLAGEAKMKLLNWFDGYLSKPIKRKEILKLLKDIEAEDLDLPEADPADNDADLPGTMDNGAATDDRIVHQIALPIQEQIPQAQTKKARILIAEDHFVNQKLFLAILKSLGFEAQAASDGRETLRKVQEYDPDLIFMDVQMPELNGYDASIQLRSSGFAKPIIAVTANALKGDVEKCYQAGMNDYLSKPFQKKDVEGMLEKWLTVQYPAESEQTDDQHLFDRSFAIKVFMDDEELLKSILEEFIERTPAMLEDLAVASRTGDREKVIHISHTLKGSSLNLGINCFGELSAKLEEAAKTMQPENKETRFNMADLDKHSECWKSTLGIIMDYLKEK